MSSSSESTAAPTASSGARETAIVFGVGSRDGLGAALCRRFANEGMHVLAAGRSLERLERVAAETASAPGSVEPIVTDATDSAQVGAAYDAAEAAGGVPRLVVYNAGRNEFSSLSEMTDAFFEDVWRVTCFAGFLVARESAQRMVPAGGGTVIFTGATASLRARPPFTAFASGKAALRAVAQGMAREYGPQGIHVGHVVIDGMIDGAVLNERFPQAKEQRGADGMLDLDAIADAYWMLHRQHPRAWTHEIDLRPSLEKW